MVWPFRVVSLTLKCDISCTEIMRLFAKEKLRGNMLTRTLVVNKECVPYENN